jgi:hypothetical protein
MTKIRKYVYAAVLAFSAINFSPSLAAAQDEGGSFSLPHEVQWQNVAVPAGDYKFSLEQMGPTEVLTIRKVSGTPVSFMLVVNDADELADASGPASLILKEDSGKSYVSSMKLPQFDLILRFTAPQGAVKEVAAMHPVSIQSSGR